MTIQIRMYTGPFLRRTFAIR